MFEPIKPGDVPRGRAANPQVQSDLAYFMEISATAGEVRIPNGQTAQQAYRAYYRAVKRGGYPIKVTVRDRRLFIIKERSAPGAATPKGGK